MIRLGLACVALVACGPNVGSDDSGAEGGTSSSGGSGSSSGSGSTTPGTSAAVTTASTGPMTTATESITQGTDESGSGTGVGSTTGSMVEECLDASDCMLFATCCDCEGIPVGGEGEDTCPEIDCEVDACTAAGIDQVECRNGRCTTVSLSCDPAGVVCPEPPPECKHPSIPGTSDGCWTGTCVRAEWCDWVPSCDYCPADEVCVSYLPGPKGATTHACEPIPAGCGGVATCECAGKPLCAAWGECFDAGENQLTCAGA